MKLLIISTLMMFGFFSSAQTLITPFASTAQDGNTSVSMSGGEPVIITARSNQVLTQGFQQPENLEKFDIYIPTAFSPASRDENDSFKIGVAEDAPIVIDEFLIYDRWGNPVYNEANIDPLDFDNWWDGTSNGKEVENGVYTFVLNYSLRGYPRTKQGSITKF